MTAALIAALALTVIGFLILADRQATRDQTERAQCMHDAFHAVTDAHNQHRQDMLDMAGAHRREVQTLLQRIQAPEHAVVEHAQAHIQDEQPYPLSDEQSVEAQRERELALERMEQFEREGILG
jgi:hypothetical protein